MQRLPRQAAGYDCNEHAVSRNGAPRAKNPEKWNSGSTLTAGDYPAGDFSRKTGSRIAKGTAERVYWVV